MICTIYQTYSDQWERELQEAWLGDQWGRELQEVQSGDQWGRGLKELSYGKTNVNVRFEHHNEHMKCTTI